MMEVNSYFSQIVVALEGHVIGCFWNNSRRFLLVWGMSSFLEQLLQSSVQIVYMLILIKCVLDLVIHDLFFVVDYLLQTYEVF